MIPPSVLSMELQERAEEFLAASRRLPRESSIGRPSWPRYFLLCHAVELSLKAFLAWHGISEHDLQRNFGHDLAKLIDTVRARTPPVDSRILDDLRHLAEAHAKHWPRYPRSEGRPVPVLDFFERPAADLLKAIGDLVCGRAAFRTAPAGSSLACAGLVLLQSAAGRMRVEIEGAISCSAMIEGGNAERFETMFRGKKAGHGLRLVHRALVINLLLTLMRLHDPWRRKRASIPSALTLLHRAAIRKALVDRQGQWIETVLQQDPEAALTALEKRIEDLGIGDRAARLERLREARNLQIAHASLEEPKTNPFYNDLFGQLAETAAIVHELAALTTSTTVSLDAPRQIWGERATAFWNAIGSATTVS